MEKLPRAPIDEVVVGFVFGTSTGLDMLEVGRYWAKRADRLPKHEIHDPIIPPNFAGDVLGPRAWLVTDDDAWLVQLQYDRLIANWRRRGDATYPGCTSPRGVKDFALEELAGYLGFWGDLKGPGAPIPVSVELAKIDVLIQGQHWDNIDDLIAMIPALERGAALVEADVRGPMVTFLTQQQKGTAMVAVSMQPARMRLDPNRLAYRLDFKAVQPTSEDLDAQIGELSQMLNDVFARTIPDHQRRFGHV